MTPKQREQRMEFCRLIATWYMNNQCTEARPWATSNGADLGRFMYEYCPSTGQWYGNAVWGQGAGAMALLALHDRLISSGPSGELLQSAMDAYLAKACYDAAIAAGGYMMSLQVLDQRNPALFGIFRQSHPQSDLMNPRDGATGCMGLCVLYRHTKNEEYLYRARIFGDWYIRNAFEKKHRWPYYTYYFDPSRHIWNEPGLWQVGAGLAFYYLYRLTGERRYLDEGLQPLMDGVRNRFPPESRPGNDDFAGVAVMGAYLLTGDARLLDWTVAHAAAQVAAQDEDGSCPLLEGAQVTGINLLNFCQLAQEKKRDIDLAPYRAATAKIARFLPTLQERDPRDLRAYGGMYGQTSFGVSRHLIHHRAACYSLIFMIREEGLTDVAGYNVFGW